MFFVGGAAVVGDAGEVGWGGFAVGLRGGAAGGCVCFGCACDFEVGVAFVVAKQDVVARVQGFDEVVFKYEGFGFGAHYGDFEPRDFAHHKAYAGAAVVFLKVARYAALEVDGFANVEDLVLRIKVAVYARQRGQGCYLGE